MTRTSSMPVRIRVATRGDASAIHGMLVDLAAGLSASVKFRSSADDILRYGFDEPAFTALLAEADSTPIGLCLFFFNFSSWRGRPGVYVQDLYCAPEQRGTGLGLRLLREAARYGEQRGATHLRLSVEAANVAAANFYRRCGLRRSSDEHIYEADGAAFTALTAGESEL